MDRVEGGPAQRLRIDQNILSNPSLTLLVPASAVAEVLPTPSQSARLTGYPGGARVIQISDGNLQGIDVGALESGTFSKSDMAIIQAAKERGFPLLTTNGAIYNQIHSHPGRRKLWDSVGIAVP